ncbi:MAG: HD domain-containing protein [Microbacterium sp.]
MLGLLGSLERMGDCADTLGVGGVYVDPLWRIEVALLPVEQQLLRSWWVRRLGFIAHAGAASITTTQSYSRLEHSLGLLALVANFSPQDATTRVTALLHDVGHLPFSHTLEGLAALNHHELGRGRIRSLAPILHAHGIDADEVIATDTGVRPSVLHSRKGGMKLDHLDSFVRSGQAHGRTMTPPAALLSRLRVVDGTVDTDASTADELVVLVAGEARAQRSTANVLPVTVLRHAVNLLLQASDGPSPSQIAVMTDDELWAALLGHPDTAPHARRIREEPQSFQLLTPNDASVLDDGMHERPTHSITRGYLDLPTVDEAPITSETITSLHRALPLSFAIGEAL